jgi:hypothetical protein
VPSVQQNDDNLKKKGKEEKHRQSKSTESADEMVDTFTR